MKMVVTGGAGFIGSRLVQTLLNLGSEVHVLDNLSTGSTIHPLATLHKVDICHPQAREMIAALKPDVVYHLAAQADVQRSIQEPDFDASVNVVGTLNLLEACRRANVRKFIFASTSAVYGKLQKEKLVETDPTQPISYYGLSKITAEHYIRLYHDLYGLNYTILRYGNVYGPGQTAKGEGGVVAVFMDRIARGMPLPINGDGEQTRDFIFVDDVAEANIAAIRFGDQGTFHVSTGSSASVNRVVDVLQDIHGSQVPVLYREAKAGDIQDSCLDNSLAEAVLSWKPAISLEEGLLRTYQFRKPQ
ncbi:NAD-dependent epimerase/dehydratase family protein [Paenibacillus aurantiacus]|uniref:NAD-dependent epimerase/dehydratase family protein n=1 Tax=Paenibacillus aurantiacus TaxID=1936118 RepID=A0ABV5KYI5_9BACL